MKRLHPGRLQFRYVADVPPTPEGFEFVTASVSSDGDGLFLFVKESRAQEVHGTHQPHGDDGPRFPKARMEKNAEFRLLVVSPETQYEIDLPPLDLSFPMFDLFPDGHILMAGARADWRAIDDYDLNGVIIDPATGVSRRILLGDGIEDLAIDTVGCIWVSYFDEGVSGNGKGSFPGAGGLVCFDEEGTELWRFNRNDGSEFILDCYAINTAGNEVWAYHYPDFNLCRVDNGLRPESLPLDGVEGATSFAVADKGFVFNATYGEPPEVLHAVSRRGNHLEHVQKFAGDFPEGFTFHATDFCGRGRHLHVINRHGWVRADIDEYFQSSG